MECLIVYKGEFVVVSKDLRGVLWFFRCFGEFIGMMLYDSICFMLIEGKVLIGLGLLGLLFCVDYLSCCDFVIFSKLNGSD